MQVVKMDKVMAVSVLDLKQAVLLSVKMHRLLVLKQELILKEQMLNSQN
jgi:hypothetical protein